MAEHLLRGGQQARRGGKPPAYIYYNDMYYANFFLVLNVTSSPKNSQNPLSTPNKTTSHFKHFRNKMQYFFIHTREILVIFCNFLLLLI